MLKMANKQHKHVPIHDLDCQRHIRRDLCLVYACSVTEGENVIVRFVDIGGIVNHHCLNFVYITLLMNKDFTIYQNIQTPVKICKKMCELMLIHPSVRWQNTCMHVVCPPQRHFCVFRYFTEPMYTETWLCFFKLPDLF